jgi:hypothetical protein
MFDKIPVGGVHFFGHNNLVRVHNFELNCIFIIQSLYFLGGVGRSMSDPLNPDPTVTFVEYFTTSILGSGLIG